MAVTLDDFKKRHADVMKKMGEEQDVVFAHTQYTGQTSGIIREGIKEWGLRVANLKKMGHPGTKVADFSTDAPAKKSLDGLKAAAAGLKQKNAEAKAHEPETKKRLEAFRVLKRELNTEVNERKGQASTALGLGNKSLPEMKKLLASMVEYGNSAAFGKIEGWMIATYDPEKHLEEELEEVLSKSGGEVAVELKNEMEGQAALDLRLLYRGMTGAKKSFDELTKLCDAAEKAHKDGNRTQFEALRGQMAAPWKNLADTAAKYHSALEKASTARGNRRISWRIPRRFLTCTIKWNSGCGFWGGREGRRAGGECGEEGVTGSHRGHREHRGGGRGGINRRWTRMNADVVGGK